MSYFEDFISRIADHSVGTERWVHVHDMGIEAQDFHEFVSLLMVHGLKGSALSAERKLGDESQRYFRVKVNRTA